MSEKIDLKNHPTVKGLVAHQARLAESDAAFTRRYLDISSSTWSLIKSGKYADMVQDIEPTLLKCAASLAILDDEAERLTLRSDSTKILRFVHVQAALNAVTGCLGQPQNRLVVFLAPTGGGKTTLTRALTEKYKANHVHAEATEAWRKSYFAAGVNLCRAIGYTEQYPVTQGATKVEADLQNFFSVQGRILSIDEGHYCGPAALNLIKFILNRTTARVVLLAIPELWERMEKAAYKEVEQLRRRTAAKIVLKQIKLNEARQFLQERLPGFDTLNGEREEITKLCCEAANTFGLWDTLDRICTEFVRESAGQPASMELVKAALKRAEALRS